MNETTDATSIFAPLWRRKWWILITALLVAAATYFHPQARDVDLQGDHAGVPGSGRRIAAREKTSGRNQGHELCEPGGSDPALGRRRNRANATSKKRKCGSTRSPPPGKSRRRPPAKSQFVHDHGRLRTAPRGAALLAGTVATAYVKRWTVTHQRSVLAALNLARRQLQQDRSGARPDDPRLHDGLEGNRSARRPKQREQLIGHPSRAARAQRDQPARSAARDRRRAPESSPRARGVKHARLAAPAQERRVRVRHRARCWAPSPPSSSSRFNRRLRSLAEIEGALLRRCSPRCPRPRARSCVATAGPDPRAISSGRCDGCRSDPPAGAPAR